jgi:uncharacterized protein YjbJ (UPF0337 family)
MFTTDELAGKWAEIKSDIGKKWSELTESDVEKTGGKTPELVTLMQEKLGLKKEEAHFHLEELAAKWQKEGHLEKSKLVGHMKFAGEDSSFKLD